MKKTILFILITAQLLFAQITFDANFESGNLNSVTTTDSINYSVTTVEDIGSRWFYFRIIGAKDKFIKVTITTSDVNRPMYSYDNIDFVRFTEAEAPQINVFQKTFEEDTVYVAYYTPYNYSYLQERLAEWSSSEFVTLDTLGYTEKNLPVQEMILTDPTKPDENKLRVWIHARTHPGETPSSWHFDGIMQKLLEDDEVIEYYRKNVIFYLYPFNNPDGVYYGRSRTNYNGVDQERDWDFIDNETSAAVLLLKNRMKELNNEKVFSVFLNLHSQASPYPTFWIHTPGSTSDFFYRREYQFTNLSISDLPYFVKSDYRESNLLDYFPEGFQWNNYGDQTLALTYETPYDYYSNDVWVTNENLFEFGYTTVYGIAEYLELSHPKHIIMDNKDALVSGDWNSAATGLEFYSDNFYYIQSGGGQNNITYQTETIESGKYDVYGWWVSNSQNANDTKFIIDANGNQTIVERSQKLAGGQWNHLSQIELSNSGRINIGLSDDADGFVVADAFRIIYRGPVTSVKENIVAESFELYQNYPNPFNPSTTIKYSIPSVRDAYNASSTIVQLKIYDILGREVATLVNEEQQPGNYEVVFNARQLSSGTYFYRLIAGNFVKTMKLILVK